MRGDMEQEEDEQSTRVLCQLCSMISHVLRSPPLPISFPGLVGPAVCRTSQASSAAFASLFLGISVALMLFGSVTFVIGFFLMPLVIGLVMIFYFVAMLYNLSEMGRTILWPDFSTTTAVPAWRSL
ncbi:hypothetical protein ACH5RR_010935 [Cinchona calisaya]|uniref:Uncharacterized protein n=1 Tax=Cinchona calisaya TaxID=153742 RepID=A0ABD3A4X0_9GENT